MTLAVEFFSAKDGFTSAKANGISLHSSYNTQAEAERFVQNLDADFNPACVVIIEGALGYCAPFLRKRFPNAKIGVVRFGADFSQSDKLFDFSLPLQAEEGGTAAAPLSERLFDALGEEGLFQSLFFEWPPSARIWPQETKEAWLQIRAAAQKAKSVLATREYFGKRWLKNKILFFTKIQKAAALNKIQKPVLICASGPSLEDAIPAIKRARDKIFVCALSSSITVLKHFGVEPDACMSADGGYWAKRHLDALQKNFLQSPLILATEAACPSILFKTKSVAPLCYDDDVFSQKISQALGINAHLGRRNGTVSGCALELFLGLSDGPIFFAGLDLQNSAKKSHARPNALDVQSETRHCRLNPKALAAAKSSFKNASLEIYADWFCGRDFGPRKIYRIKGSQEFKRRLGQIKDISAAEFEGEFLAAAQTKSAGAFFCEQKIEQKKERLQTMQKLFLEWTKDADFKAEMFPADTILARREKDSAKKKERELLIEKKTRELFEEIFKGQGEGLALQGN